MPEPVAAVILASYASLAFELFVLRVPSVASSLSIWAPDAELLAGYSPRYRALFTFGAPRKILLFVLPLLAAYGLFLYPLLVVWQGQNLLGDDLFEPGAATASVAISLMILGRFVALRSASTIRRRNAQRGRSFHLHTTGLFRWSRNPGLVGMYLFVAGLWLCTPSALMAVGALVYVLHMDFKVRMEEDFLQNKFGRAYLEYRSKTGRYLP